MNMYEKVVAQLERKDPKVKYIVERHPITDKGKQFFGVFEYGQKEQENVNYPFLKKLMENNRKKNNTKFEYIFYYDDPTETEKEREEEAIRHSIDTLTRFSFQDIKHGIDYKVSVEKVSIFK